MATRISSRQITFRRPFVLSGFVALQVAGTYRVDNEEERPDAASSAAWNCVATTLHLTRSDATACLQVDATELHEALMRDEAQPDLSSPCSASPQSRRKNARDTMRTFTISAQRR